MGAEVIDFEERRMPTPEERRREFWNTSSAGFMSEFLNDYESESVPVTTTIRELDEMLAGGFRPGLHIIGGNTGAGKSALCLWMASRIASLRDRESGENVGVTYVSLELSKAEVMYRMLSNISLGSDGLEPFRWSDAEEWGAWAHRSMEDGSYDPAHDRVYCAYLKFCGLCPKFRVVDSISDTHVGDLFNVVDEIGKTATAGGRILFVDYLQCIDASDPDGLRAEDEQASMRRAVRALNLAGIKHGVAVVCISAVNRGKGGEMRKSGKGTNPGSDIFRGSSWLEYTCLSGLALVRREDAMTVGGSVEEELYVVKNRRGVSGSVDLLYCGEYGRFQTREG